MRNSIIYFYFSSSAVRVYVFQKTTLHFERYLLPKYEKRMPHFIGGIGMCRQKEKVQTMSAVSVRTN